MAETISFERVKTKKEWRKQRFLVIGAAKIGKSELFSVGEGTLFLDVEGTLGNLDNIAKIPKERPFLDWDELESAVDNLVALKHTGKFPAHIDTIVFDTATRMVNLATIKTVELLNKKFNKEWESIEEINIGGDKGNPGWPMRTNLVDNLLAKAKQLNVAIVVIGHMDRKKIKNDKGIEIEMQTISIGGNLGKAFVNNANHILNIISSNDNGIITRTVRALGTATIEAGSHGLCVPDNWVLVNPKSRTTEDMQIAAKANYDKLRSFFAE